MGTAAPVKATRKAPTRPVAGRSKLEDQAKHEEVADPKERQLSMLQFIKEQGIPVENTEPGSPLAPSPKESIPSQESAPALDISGEASGEKPPAHSVDPNFVKELRAVKESSSLGTGKPGEYSKDDFLTLALPLLKHLSDKYADQEDIRQHKGKAWKLSRPVFDRHGERQGTREDTFTVELSERFLRLVLDATQEKAAGTADDRKTSAPEFHGNLDEVRKGLKLKASKKVIALAHRNTFRFNVDKEKEAKDETMLRALMKMFEELCEDKFFGKRPFRINWQKCCKEGDVVQLFLSCMFTAMTKDGTAEAGIDIFRRLGWLNARFLAAASEFPIVLDLMGRILLFVGTLWWSTLPYYLAGASRRIMTEFGGQIPKRVEDLFSFAFFGHKMVFLYRQDAPGVKPIGIVFDVNVHKACVAVGLADAKHSIPVAEKLLRERLPPELWKPLNEYFTAIRQKWKGSGSNRQRISELARKYEKENEKLKGFRTYVLNICKAK
ncbi:MAG: hypothetical protein SGILL_000268 [Bacillariaceae sp.]